MRPPRLWPLLRPARPTRQPVSLTNLRTEDRTCYASIVIYQAETEEDYRSVRVRFAEYVEWLQAWFLEELGILFDLQARVEEELGKLARFTPPGGRLLLATVGSELVGMACLANLGDGAAEVKRVVVRPALRGRGLGRALLDNLVQDAASCGYTKLRLDTAQFLTEALSLYRSSGFREIAAYPGTEIPEELNDRWFFLVKDLV